MNFLLHILWLRADHYMNFLAAPHCRLLLVVCGTRHHNICPFNSRLVVKLDIQVGIICDIEISLTMRGIWSGNYATQSKSDILTFECQDEYNVVCNSVGIFL